MVDAVLCFFNGCHNTALPSGKCDAHKMRAKCVVDACHNQTYARSMCVKHGGKLKCIADNCTANARSHGLCCKHGPKAAKTLCSVDGCTKVAHARHRCVRHGGGQICKVDNCTAYARTAGMCCRHNYFANTGPSLEFIVRSLSSTDECHAADDHVTVLQETTTLELDCVIETEQKGKCTSIDIEFSPEDCDWLEYMMASIDA